MPIVFMAGRRAAIQHPKGEICGPSSSGVQAPGRLSEQEAKIGQSRRMPPWLSNTAQRRSRAF
ncbi:hypothetical protein XCCB100_0358 [Xanthomonas campestris pv. campestris]|uniref:Uncharacterized protein n=1 Tax=Xanthomonas campestris pv. campestris (strain B100) TaxID=509169 RepID=B0RMA2_XANCB|nr:hypothetical protein XCCB100_0358 [Xanthomonas campestris pv. campestris]